MSTLGKKLIFKNPEERIRKIKLARTKQVITDKHKINIGLGNKGKKRSIKAKKKYQIASKIRQDKLWQNPKYRKMMSESHLKGEPGNQLGRARLEYFLWRKVIQERDDFTCQKCGKRGGRLEVHHIFSWAKFPELRFAINNGITLCENCHKLTNNYGGRKK